MTGSEQPHSYSARLRYTGEQARVYEAQRLASERSRAKWRAEMATLERLLATLPAGSRLLDLPAGTGRFVPLFEAAGWSWVAGDISLDMLEQLRRRPEVPHKLLVACDAENLPFPPEAFDFVLSIRFFNLVPDAVAGRALAEMARVARCGVVIQVRLFGDRSLDRATRRLKALARPLRRVAASLRRGRWHPRHWLPGPPPGHRPRPREPLLAAAGRCALSLDRKLVVEARRWPDRLDPLELWLLTSGDRPRGTEGTP